MSEYFKIHGVGDVDVECLDEPLPEGATIMLSTKFMWDRYQTKVKRSTATMLRALEEGDLLTASNKAYHLRRLIGSLQRSSHLHSCPTKPKFGDL